jgi:hypothetical protein
VDSSGLGRDENCVMLDGQMLEMSMSTSEVDAVEDWMDASEA